MRNRLNVPDMNEDRFHDFRHKSELKTHRLLQEAKLSHYYGAVLLGAGWPRLSAVRGEVGVRARADLTELVNQMKGPVRPKGKRVKICMEAVERFTSPLLAAETLQPKPSKLLLHLIRTEARRQGGFPLMCCCLHATTVSSWCQLSLSHMKENGGKTC